MRSASVRAEASPCRGQAAAILVLLGALASVPGVHAVVGLPGLKVPESRLQTLPGVEQRLLRALNAIAEARLDQAENYLQAVLEEQPDYRLARLVYADVLSARSGGSVADLGRGAAAARVRALLAEARARVRHARSTAASESLLPDVLLQVAEDVPRVFVVDIEAARLYLYDNIGGSLILSRSRYVSTAKNGPGKLREGDQRTPVGVYFITSQIAEAALPDFYGPGALPVNYPNVWDRRSGWTGHGIWLHGVPSDTYARPPRASDGCIALSNIDMSDLLSLPGVEGTPVIIADRVNWVGRDELARRRGDALAVLDGWREAWESRDVQRYAAFYAGSFSSGDRDREAWIAHKRRVNAAKRYIEVRLSNVSAFTYPGEPDLMVVDFEQDYRSDDYSGVSRKRQYWQRQADGRWQVINEDQPRVLPIHLRGMPFSARTRLSSR